MAKGGVPKDSDRHHTASRCQTRRIVSGMRNRGQDLPVSRALGPGMVTADLDARLTACGTVLVDTITASRCGWAWWSRDAHAHMLKACDRVCSFELWLGVVFARCTRTHA